MKLLRILFFSFPFFSCDVFAQRSREGEKPLTLPLGDSLSTSLSVSADTVKPQLTVIASDTGEIPIGIIYVRKPHITPYVKVNYKLYLAHVNPKGSQRDVLVTDRNSGFTDTQVEPIPTFDSNMYSKKLKREYPVNADPLSKYFVENLRFQYQPNDTPRVDTMLIEMWIDPRGKIKWIMPDTEYVGNMSSALVRELDSISWRISDWGTECGYHTTRKFLRPSHLILESYYCEAFVIVSSYPLTQEQRKTGKSYAPFDYPLNCPPINPEQKSSLENNLSPTTVR